MQTKKITMINVRFQIVILLSNKADITQWLTHRQIYFNIYEHNMFYYKRINIS